MTTNTVGEIVDQLPQMRPQHPQLPQVPSNDVSGAGALMRIIERAANDPSFDVDKLGKLLDVRERWEAAEARKAFVTALARFKAAPPTITKNKRVSFTTRDGDLTEYDHATLDQVCNAVAPALSRHGLSHRWETKQEAGLISVTCVLTHIDGHSERVMLQAGADASGKKNAIQQIASTVSYLERYTLLAATGLATEGQDDDGDQSDQETITPMQVAELERLIKETAANEPKLLAFLKVDALTELRAADFVKALQALEERRNKRTPSPPEGEGGGVPHVPLKGAGEAKPAPAAKEEKPKAEPKPKAAPKKAPAADADPRPEPPLEGEVLAPKPAEAKPAPTLAQERAANRAAAQAKPANTTKGFWE